MSQITGMLTRSMRVMFLVIAWAVCVANTQTYELHIKVMHLKASLSVLVFCVHHVMPSDVYLVGHHDIVSHHARDSRACVWLLFVCLVTYRYASACHELTSVPS
jgi:hypothetical protein